MPTTAENGYPWIKIVNGTTPTVAYGTDSVLGTVECALSSGSNTQEAVIYMGDQRYFRVGYGTIMEIRAKTGAAISAAGSRVFFGFSGDQATGEVAYRIGFSLRYASATASTAWAECDDASTDNTATTSTTITSGTYYIFRIDASDLDDVKYYINGVLVKSGLEYGGTTTALVLQPMIKVYKSTGTTTGSVAVDYIKIWSNRE